MACLCLSSTVPSCCTFCIVSTKLKEGYHVSSPFFNVVATVEMELCHYDN